MKRIFLLTAVLLTAASLFAQSGDYTKYERESAVNVINDFKFVPIPGKNYSISETEVTQALYEAVMGENPSRFVGNRNPVENVSWYGAIYFCNKFSEMNGKTPVYSVNGSTDTSKWEYFISENIEQNLNADGYRLPTEEEWEYAAKGGQEFKFSGSNNLDEVGWYENNSDETTHPVAQKKPNGYGLYDMSGNVWEWCWFDRDNVGRYRRGGSYKDDDFYCLSYYGDSCNALRPWDDQGFRLVCTTFEK